MDTKKELYFMFLDLSAAFDRVNRSIVWNCLRLLNVPEKLMRVIENLYKTVKGTVQMNGEISETFEMERGIKQGDSLSPLLFIILMDRIMKNTKIKTRKYQMLLGYNKIDNLLIAETKTNIEKLAQIWNEEIERMGLKLNIDKCKVMIMNKREITNSPKEIFIKDHKIQDVTSYEYLGSIISQDGKIDLDINNRLRKTNKTCYSLNKVIFAKRKIEKETKLRLYNSVIVPILMYASESWTLHKNQEHRLTAMEMKVLRRIEGVTKWDRMRNEEIRQRLKQESIISKIEVKQLNWYAHIRRMKENTIVKKVYDARSGDKRRRGRPRKRWEERIKEIGERKGKSFAELKEIARDRDEWRKWIRK